MGYENRGEYRTETLVQKGKYNVAIFVSMAINELDYLEVLTAIAGKIHKVHQDRLRLQWYALIDTDHNQLKSLLYEHRWMNRQDFVDEACRIINSEKLMQ